MSALQAAAAAAGLTRAYRDGAGRWQEAPDAAVEAVLAALGVGNPAAALPEALRAATTEVVPAGTPRPAPPGPWRLIREDGGELAGTGPLPPLPAGYHRLEAEGRMIHLIADPGPLPLPARGWGVTVPIFALWRNRPAGMGDYALLGDLAADLGRAGAAFVGINPVHAGFPADPGNFSPYAPSHRRRLNVLHVATGAALPETGALIDHGATVPAQMAALRAAFAARAPDPAYDRWRAAGGAALEAFARHQALSDRFGPYWPDWPAALHDPDGPAVAAFAAGAAESIAFHAWAQWQAETQLAAAQARARAAGMAIGLYLDLAVGTHPAGAETWAEPGLFARGVSLGAPPDLLGPSGQRWGLAPMRPDVLRATGMAAFRETIRAQLRHAGMLRIDHALGLERSFWLPEGLPGLYVAMPREALLAVLRIEAARAGAVVVGEDLGTVPEGLRAALAASGILGCRVAMFERDWDGTGAFLPPSGWPAASLASWGTHDVPTWAGWRAGRDLDWRAALGELPDAGSARAERAAEVAAFDALAGTGPEAGAAALARHLAGAGSALVALQAEDLAGMDEQVNLPGTVHEHPNWRRRLPLSAPALAAAPALAEAARIMAAAGRAPHREESR